MLRLIVDFITSSIMCPPSAALAHSTSLDPSSIIPKTPTSKAAYTLASSVLHPAILNHSIRTYLYASALAVSRGSMYSTDSAKKDLLFTACIMHDIGTTDTYNGRHRFEVEGADAASSLLEKFGIGEEERMEVWKAIALHTTVGIVQRMGALSALVRQAIEIDFGRTKVVEIADLEVWTTQVEDAYPRNSIEKVLGDAVVKQAIANPVKAPPASWPGVMYKAHLEDPTWQGINKAF